MIEKMVKDIGRRAGLEVSHYRPFAARRARQLAAAKVSTVIDVGANRGQFGSDLRAFGYKGRIVSLEPLSAAFAELESRASADPRWEYHNVAAGSTDGEATINVASEPTSSSFLEMREEHRLGAPEVSLVARERVQMRTLDSLALDTTPPMMLKIDVQGFEDRVLAGATETLADVALLECELSIASLYDGQPSFRAMIDRLSDLGFELVDVDPFFYDRSDGRVLAMDALFSRAMGSHGER